MRKCATQGHPRHCRSQSEPCWALHRPCPSFRCGVRVVVRKALNRLHRDCSWRHPSIFRWSDCFAVPRPVRSAAPNASRFHRRAKTFCAFRLIYANCLTAAQRKQRLPYAHQHLRTSVQRRGNAVRPQVLLATAIRGAKMAVRRGRCRSSSSKRRRKAKERVRGRRGQVGAAARAKRNQSQARMRARVSWTSRITVRTRRTSRRRASGAVPLQFPQCDPLQALPAAQVQQRALLLSMVRPLVSGMRHWHHSHPAHLHAPVLAHRRAL